MCVVLGTKRWHDPDTLREHFQKFGPLKNVICVLGRLHSYVIFKSKASKKRSEC